MEKYNVKFKKKFGQNFLKDISLVKKIVSIGEVDENSLVIEVGPGGAIMTRELALVAKNVLAYEIDRDLSFELCRRLNGLNNVDVLFQDFLDSDLREDVKNYEFQKLLFISNVPYYITTPIIFKLINSGLEFQKIVMMVQKEVGERFTTLPGNREYGAITVLLNYYFDVKKELNVSRKQFVPEPNVDSMVVSFSNRKSQPKLIDEEFFIKLVRDSFQFKRKNLKNNLKNYDLNVVSDVLVKYNYDLTVRAENLSYLFFVDLANSLCDH